MSACQRHPLKLYIQDIYRAERTEHNYTYELFGLQFKNVMIHGIVTSIYNNTGKTANFELTDSTATIQIYYDSTKNNYKVSDNVMKNLMHEYQSVIFDNSDKVSIMGTLKDSILLKKEKPINFEVGAYLAVVGDIFLDHLKKTRMVSAYECNVTSVQREIIWMEELQYLYEKFYLWKKE